MKLKVVPFERKLVGAMGDDNNPISDTSVLQQLNAQMAASPALKVSMQNVFSEFCTQLRYRTSSTSFDIPGYRNKIALVTAGVLQAPPESVMNLDLTLIDREKYLALRKALDTLPDAPDLSLEQVFSDMLMNPRELFV